MPAGFSFGCFALWSELPRPCAAVEALLTLFEKYAQAMATKAGVWIDHKQAIVVLITDAGQEIKKFKSGSASAVGSRPNNKYTPNDFIAEDRRERKLASDHKKLYGDVLASILGAESLFILGPGEAKGEFDKHIKAKKLRGITVELEAADKMTDGQIAAKVRQHFATGSAK